MRHDAGGESYKRDSFCHAWLFADINYNDKEKEIKKMKRIHDLLVIVCAALLCSICAEAAGYVVRAEDTTTQDTGIPQELGNLYARSAVLMDADNGRVLFGKEEETVMPMASTTKIMTCILVLEHTDAEEEATVSEYAQSQPKVHLGAIKGEKYRVGDLLYSMMLESHNDSAVILAEHVAGNVEAFADMMNQKAKEIGCMNTHFVTPNGLDGADEDGIHATTATDLARIMRYCIHISEKREEFLKITQTPAYQFTDLSGTRSFSCTNHNAFLTMMEGALSGKTGFTADAGYCYVGALSKDDKTYIVALLACGWPNHKTYKWQDTKTLMTYGLEQYAYEDIWKKVVLPKIIVENSMDSVGKKQMQRELQVKLLNSPQSLMVLVREGETPRIEMEIKEILNAPVKNGEVVGVVRYWIDESFLGEWQVVSCENVEEKTYRKVYRRLVKYMLNMSIFYPCQQKKC